MKKTIAVLLVLVLVFSLAMPAGASPFEEEEAARNHTYGIAKGYVRTSEICKRDKGDTQKYIWIYDKKGNRIKEVETTKNDNYSSTAIAKWTYDKKGNMTKQVLCESDRKITETFAYNKAGKLTKESRKIVYEDNLTYTSVRYYTYNKAGKVTKELAYYDDCEEVKTYTYDKKGNVTKEGQTQSYEDNTQAVTSTTFTYDKKGNVTKEVIVEKDRDGSVDKRTFVSTYNEAGQCFKDTQIFSFISDGQKTTSRAFTTRTFDKNGSVKKVVVQTISGNGRKGSMTIVRTYDQKNNLTKEVTAEESPDYAYKTTKTYAYDKKGNLVKKTTVVKDSGGVERINETYAYDKAGNLTKYVCSGDVDKIVKTFTYQKIES